MRTLLALAARQGGVIVRSQLSEHDVGEDRAERLVRRGEWQRVIGGVYRVYPARDDLDRLKAAVSALPAVVSHGSAGHLLGLVDRPPPRPSVTVPPSATHRYPEVWVRRSPHLPDDHLGSTIGLPTTSVARTLVDLAVDLEPVYWRAVAGRALQARRTTKEAIGAVAALLCGRGRRGSGVVKELLGDEQADASVLERRALRVLASVGLPAPRREFPIPWSPAKRFDLAYPDQMLAIELDGRRFHDRPDAFERDRERDRTAATHGWVVVRFTWTDVNHRPHELVRTVATLLDVRTQG